MANIPNQLQVMAQIRLGIASAGGPIGSLVVMETGMIPGKYELWAAAVAWLASWVVVGIWSWIATRRANLVKTVEQLPEVATVVIKDTANGTVAKLTNGEHPNIVTESQNEQDALKGRKAA